MEINEVLKFTVVPNDHLYYLQNNKFVVNGKTIDTFENSHGDIYSNSNFVIWQNYSGYFDVYSLEGHFITKRRGYFNYLTRKNEDLFYYDSDKNCLRLIQFIDLDISFSVVKSNGVINSDFFFEIKKNVLDIYSLKENKLLSEHIIPESKYDWYNLDNVYISERSVPIKAEIKKILGKYNEIIWISLNSGRLLGLDVHTGDLQHDLAVPSNFFANFVEEFKNFSSAAGSLLDEDMGVIFGLHLTYYWEIDLTDPENKYIMYDISEQCDQNLIGGGEITQDLVWKNEEIFFHQWSFAQDPTYVGIFNRNTRQITWTSRELGEEGVFKGVKKVEFSENRLYVLDRANTLHIFER